MCRTVTLVVIDPTGAPLGVLPPFDLPVPYWAEVTDVVAAARARYGVEVTVLRLLTAGRPAPHGGPVSYLVEAAHLPARYVGPVRADLSPHPLRADYAVPGGPAATVRWALSTLADPGRVTAVRQQRTWNLSAVWRLDTDGEPLWIKQVPPFFRHEPTVLRWLARAGAAAVVTPLLADDGAGRMLFRHVPGDDLHDAPVEVRAAVAAAWHPVQVAAARQVATLLAAGIPDDRPARLAPRIAAVAAGHPDPRLRDLVAGLGARLDAVAACGVPDTLVHGDLHPGNVRGRPGGNPVIIDWGDAFVGHPAFDILRLTGGLDPADARLLVDRWAARWRADVPGSEPHRAVDLLLPVTRLRDAVVYADFLAAIEPAEHPYHAADVGRSLDAAVGA